MKTSRRITRILLATAGFLALAGATGAEGTLFVGVYTGDGASPVCVTETIEALRIDEEIAVVEIGPLDVAGEALERLDVLVFPGGSGSRQYASLGSGTVDLVRAFVVERGGGIVGICAGGYLVSDSEGYPCLGLVGADTIDREHDKRGSAVVRVRFTGEGLRIFPEMAGRAYGFIQYHDGPVFVPPGGADEFSACAELAVNTSDVHHTGDAPAGITPDTAFLLAADAGAGRVFACAGHPESTRGMRWMVPRMVRWAARKELVSYGNAIVGPDIDPGEIMHSDEQETDCYWRLFAAEPAARIAALEELTGLRHRNGARWARGLLRDRDPGVRLAAARELLAAEYTAAIADIEAQLRRERNEECRTVFEETLRALRGMYGAPPPPRRP